MTLLVVWLHLAAVVVWVGGVSYQLVAILGAARGERVNALLDAARGERVNALLDAARGERVNALLDAARRGRPITWTAVGVVVLTGFYNVTQLGPHAAVGGGGPALVLAGKFILVIAAITLAGQRDFNHLPRATALRDAGADPAPALRAMVRLDGFVLGLAAVIMYLGLSLSRR